MKEKFSVRDTNIVKGIAVIMLLWHHLFYDVDIHSITGFLAHYGKICVAIFVVLSGYGLTESYICKDFNIIKFYKKNLKKLYVNYWTIWILFVPLGIILGKRTLVDAYSDHIIIKLIINLLGFQRVFGFDGYNATWWFMSLILGLYIMYPLAIKHIIKHTEIALLIAFVIMFIPNVKIFNLDIIDTYSTYLFSFILGIYASKMKIFDYVKNLKIKGKCVILLVILGGLFFVRFFGKIFTHLRVDAFIAVIIICISYIYISNKIYINNLLEGLGKRSSNIFLFHTFMYYYYFPEYIYFFKNPIVIFLILLLVCVLIDCIIQRIRKKVILYFRQM